MKLSKIFLSALAFITVFTACSTTQNKSNSNSISTKSTKSEKVAIDAIDINLSDNEININGTPAETNPELAVYIGNDIIYYETGKDFTYGEGSDKDAHSAELAAEHTVVHITQPGTYNINGSLSKGQIAIDLGDDANKNPEAIVTLILNETNITCKVAPAIIFYNVYECDITDTDKFSKDVDTSAAGANVIIADGTTNIINGSYVARIYKPDSIILNETKTEVIDAKKLHKYDGALYSKMSMNINGGNANTGVLTINAENEGLDSELHLTINGGIININSGNDGINTNKDGASVTTINGGELNIKVSGETGEGDGIDSNGWLVINGGTVTAQACSLGGDAGIDSDMGIHINGGTVIATGHMLDRIEDNGQNYVIFKFAKKQSGSTLINLKDEKGNSLFDFSPTNSYSTLIYSSPNLKAGTYTLWSNEIQLAGSYIDIAESPDMQKVTGPMQDGTAPPEPPKDDRQFDKQKTPKEMQQPNDMNNNTKKEFNDHVNQNQSAQFQISDGGNMFQGISLIK